MTRHGLLCLMTLGLITAAYGDAPDLASLLLPHPQEITQQNAAYPMPSSLLMDLAAPDSARERLQARVNETIARMQFVAKVTETADTGYRIRIGEPKAALDPASLPESARAEGYLLTVDPDGVIISACSEQGLYHGLMTFEQLMNVMAATGAKVLPCVAIRDWPALPMRGYHEDYGRDQLPTLEDHKRTIRILAQYKVNTYLWFIEPDHFAYAFDPNISTEYDRFTFDEIRELVAYAKQYYIEVIPVVELLGHMEMTLRHDRYKGLAEMEEGGGDLCATRDESFNLVKNMVNEIAPAFDGRYFHCGLDESYAIGKGKSAQAVQEKGIERVFADYYTRMDELVKGNGRTMMMYADIVLNHPGILNILPKDIVMMFWNYSPADHYPGLDQLKAAGCPVNALSGLWDWNNLYPNYAPAFRNMQTMAAQAAACGASGHFVSSWGDGYRGAAGVNLSELNAFGYVFCSAVSWNPATLDMEPYAKAFATQFFGSADPALSTALTTLGQIQDNHNCEARFVFHDDAQEIAKKAREADAAKLDYWKELRTRTQQVHAVIAPMTPPRNPDYLRSIELATRMLSCAADMFLAVYDGVHPETPGFEAGKATARINAVAEQQWALWDVYEATWRATNRPLNLVHIERVWKNSNASLRAFAGQVSNGGK